jgi:Outer membrane protein Omp28/Secretion system C-terminal sorting domain
MKKILFFLASFACLSLNAQTFSDDFESYKAGDFVAKTNNKWTTWSNTPGTTEDTKVSAEKAHGGTLAAKFSSTAATGGPTDLVLPFFGSLTQTNDVGLFESTMWFYVPKGKTAYFNYQAKNPVGGIWAMDVYFDADSTFRCICSGAGGLQGKTKYKQDTWVKYSCSIDMTTNNWVISLDDQQVAKFSTSNNSLFAMDIFPSDANALFYVDDITTKYTPFVPKQLDASVNAINGKSKTFKGKQLAVTATCRNIGIDTIKTIDYSWTDGVSTYTEKLANLAIPKLASFTLTPKDLYTADPKANKINFTITKVNGKTDDDITNNKKDFGVAVITPAAGKKIIAEEATGTWCQWCPRGHVFMNYMAKEYPDHFIGIAVHGSGTTDPMIIQDYADLVVDNGYPEAKVNRKGASIDPSGLEDAFFARVVETQQATITNNVSYNKVTKEMKVDVKVTFGAGVAPGNYKIVAVVAEDSIKGVGAGYNQANAYANNAAGVMGGYEKLANPVPAAKMFYNHTARKVLTTVDGDDLVTDPKPGTTITKSFTYTIPTTSKEKFMEFVAFVLDGKDEVHNGEITKFPAFKVTGTNDLVEHPYFQTMYPNPTDKMTYIDLNIQESSDIKINVTDMNGRVVASRDFGKMQGSNLFPLDCSDFSSGVYFVRINIGNEIVTKKLVKE